MGLGTRKIMLDKLRIRTTVAVSSEVSTKY